MTIERTLWTTIECVAWSKGFDYSSYLDLHHKTQEKGGRLSEDGYVAICRVFEDEMIRGMRLEGFKG